MKQELYNAYIRDVEIHMDRTAVNQQKFAEIKADIHEFLEKQQGTSRKDLEKLLYEEYGTPEDLARVVSNYGIGSKPSFMPLLLALLALAIALITPYNYAPLGIYCLYIAIYTVVTKKPFAFAYYRKSPQKVNQRGFLWAYGLLIFGFGLFLIFLEWQRWR